MGRRTEYDPNTFPLLAENYARRGYSDTQIAKKLGIGKTTLYVYENLYPEFRDAIKRGKRPVDVEVENALLKRAMGYEYEEESTEIRVNDDGSTQPAVVKRTKKFIPPDVGAQVFWLTNRQKDEWKNTRVSQLSGPDGGPIPVNSESTVIILPEKDLENEEG